MAEANKFKLGLFVCLAAGVICVSVIMLGIADQFRAKAYIVTFVSESVQGLAPGSNVKYRGVPIGRVSDITIDTTGKLIRIDMSINLSKFRVGTEDGPDNPSLSKTEFYAYLLNDIKKGLRCKIEPDGITGMKYMELDFVQDAVASVHGTDAGFRSSNVFHVPSVPSLMLDLRTGVVNILTKLEAVDYEGISRKVMSTLDSAQRVIDNPDFAATVKNFEEVSSSLKVTVDNFNTNLDSAKIKALTDHMEAVMKSLDTLSAFTRKEIAEAKLGQTSADTRLALRAVSDAGGQLSEALMKLNEAMDAITELIQVIDADPSSILRGKNARSEE